MNFMIMNLMINISFNTNLNQMIEENEENEENDNEFNDNEYLFLTQTLTK